MKTKIAAFIAVGVIFIGAGGYFLKTLYFPTPEIVVNTQDTTAVATSTDQQPNTWQSNTIFSTEKDWVYAANGIPNLVSTSTNEGLAIKNGVVSCSDPIKKVRKNIQPAVDIDTFQVLVSQYAPHYMRDKNHVWNNECRLLPEADPHTFTTISLRDTLVSDDDFAKDTHHLWAWSKEVKNVDLKTFSIIDRDNNGSGIGESDSFYAKDKNHVFLLSFDDNVSDDKDVLHVEIIDQALPETFSLIVLPNNSTSGGGQTAYSKDSAHVFRYNKIIPSADPKTFVIVDALVSKDVSRVWIWNKEVENVDPATFSVIGSNDMMAGMGTGGFFSKDKNHVFSSFEAEDFNRSNGDDSISYTKILEQANPATFSILETVTTLQSSDPKAENSECFNHGYYDKGQTGYSTDGNHVYYSDTLMKGVDAKTFRVMAAYDTCKGEVVPINGIDARDGNRTFLQGKVVSSVSQ